MRTAAAVALGSLLALLAACSDDTPTPTGTASSPHSAVHSSATVINPGDDIQARVNAAPTGTAFLLKAGVHRLQSVTPKNGMSFTGERGAILSGARLLTRFTRQGRFWVASAQTQEGPSIPNQRPNGKYRCEPSWPRCVHPEDLFLNDRRLRHVESLSEVVPGAWFFDYPADKIYFVDDPTGQRVEATVLPRAIAGVADNVTIRGLIIEKYATPLQDAALRADGGTGWLIEGSEARWNHAIGLFTGTRTVARHNAAHHNGQQGMGGTGEAGLIEDNEIAYNNVPQAMAYGWTAGGTKWHRTRNVVLRRNYVHHNLGPGLWADIDNLNTLMEYNRVDNNSRNGIFFEISYGAVIRFNRVAGNGYGHAPDSLRGGGIAVTSSPDVEVYGNTLVNNRVGFAMNQDEKGSGTYGVHAMRNLYVHDNTLTQPTGYTGFDVNVPDLSYYTSKNNRFVHNTYTLGSNPKPFWWANGPRTPQEWRAYGQDVTGTFTRR